MKPVTLLPGLNLTLALPLLLIASAYSSPAAELPAASAPQQSAQPVAATGSLTAYIVDQDGDAIIGARITLIRAGDPTPRTALSDSSGGFTLAAIPSGPYTLSITAPGFAPAQTAGELHPGDTLNLPNITLSAGFIANIEVNADPTRIAEAEVHVEEKQRVLGAIPNYFVVYDSNPAPLASRQKFELAYKTQIDPISFILTGVIAGAQQASHSFAWELGASGYAKRYAASYGTFLTGNFLTDAILPSIFKQDPRYYYKGTGTIRHRTLYAIANAVICKGDNGHWQPAYSGILGSLAASGISNLYYPAANRNGAELTFEGVAIGTGFTAVGNIMQEFVVRKITPHSRPPARPKQ